MCFLPILVVVAFLARSAPSLARSLANERVVSNDIYCLTCLELLVFRTERPARMLHDEMHLAPSERGNALSLSRSRTPIGIIQLSADLLGPSQV